MNNEQRTLNDKQ